MAATQDPQTDVRLQVDEPRRPPEPPESPDRRIAAIALVAVILVGACIATGFVLATGSGNDGPGQAATAAPAAGVAAKPTATTAAPATPARRIAVTLKEFTVNPQPGLGRAGTVTFRVRNAGRIKHEFVVLRTPKAADALRKGSEASEAGNVGEIGDVQPGASKSLKLDLKRGHYALICNLPGHYLAGQHADFTVR
jgi:uncharacterized cupredoxin-like copper-binding protein